LGTGPSAEGAAEVGGNVVAAAVAGTVVGATVVGAAVPGTVVGATVVGAAVPGTVVGATVVGAVVAVGVGGASSAMTCVVPKGFRARTTETTRAAETVGYATTALRRIRRAEPLFMRVTGISLVWLDVGGRTSGGPVDRATRSS